MCYMTLPYSHIKSRSPYRSPCSSDLHQQSSVTEMSTLFVWVCFTVEQVSTLSGLVVTP